MILTYKEKQTLIKAMDLLIESEQDTVCHEKLLRKLFIKPKKTTLCERCGSDWCKCEARK